MILVESSVLLIRSYFKILPRVRGSCFQNVAEVMGLKSEFSKAQKYQPKALAELPLNYTA